MGINICYGNDSVRYGWMAASINTLISQADETVDVQKFKGRICSVSQQAHHSQLHLNFIKHVTPKHEHHHDFCFVFIKLTI